MEIKGKHYDLQVEIFASDKCESCAFYRVKCDHLKGDDGCCDGEFVYVEIK